jgi:hypothetical protein
MTEYTCEHRKVADDGRIICSKIILGDNQVSPNLCRGCPAKACNCEHLRFSLQRPALSPIIVRWGNGRTEIWDDRPPAVSFVHSACEARTIPISSPRDCIGCPLRDGFLPQEGTQTATQEVMVLPVGSLEYAQDEPCPAETQGNVIPFVRPGAKGAPYP